MKKYWSLFRIKFTEGLQYRAAALGGIATQFFWGLMEIMIFRAFYASNPNTFPMTMEALASYVWLQQAFLSLYMMWGMERNIFTLIQSGNVAYELCRPLGLYEMWFARAVAFRLSKAVLRCLPILIVAFLLPKPYGLSLPASPTALLWFLASMALSLLVVVAFGMILYMTTFFTLDYIGVWLAANNLTEFLSGGIVPMPFFPPAFLAVAQLLPFASMQNAPFRIYSGDIAGTELFRTIGLQIFWVLALWAFGKLLSRSAIRKTVVQGG